MQFTKLHYFLIIIFAAIASLAIFFIIPIWACWLASFICIIAVTLMLNDYFEERRLKTAIKEAESKEGYSDKPLDESYPEWHPSKTVESEASELPRKKAVPLYMKLFDMDEVRASNLYNAGFYNLSYLREAEMSELVKVKGINPTVARRIQRRIR